MSQKLTKEERSERMRQAWARRKAKMAAIKGMGPTSPQILSNADKVNGSRGVGFQIPSIRNQEEVNAAIAEQFFEYLKFAASNQDSGILRTEKFKMLSEYVKSQVLKK